MVSSFKPFRYRSIDDLDIEFKRLGIKLPLSNEKELLKKEIKFKNVIIPNRLAVQPMEGFDATIDGAPSELTFRRYKRYAKGGAALIWFEATAIMKEGRSNNHQLYITEQNLPKFQQLVKNTRKLSNSTLKKLGFDSESFLVLQLNHSGRYSKIDNHKLPIKVFNFKELDDAMQVNSKFGKVLSDTELEELEDLWVNKAILAKKCGFDAVDIKACHGYLISELLAARSRENSIYGGSLENRSRFLINIISKLNKVLELDNFHITSRFGLYDGNPFPSGFGVEVDSEEKFPATANLNEPLLVVKKLYDLGVRLINFSAGNPHFKPMLTRPYDRPIKGGKTPQEHPLISVERLIKLCYEAKSSLPEDMVIIGSGYSYLRQFAGYLAAGAIKDNFTDICGFGRMAIANPNFPKQVFQNGIIDKNQSCISCSKCSQFMREGKNTGCAIRDPVYKGKV